MEKGWLRGNPHRSACPTTNRRTRSLESFSDTPYPRPRAREEKRDRVSSLGCFDSMVVRAEISTGDLNLVVSEPPLVPRAIKEKEEEEEEGRFKREDGSLR